MTIYVVGRDSSSSQFCFSCRSLSTCQAGNRLQDAGGTPAQSSDPSTCAAPAWAPRRQVIANGDCRLPALDSRLSTVECQEASWENKSLNCGLPNAWSEFLHGICEMRREALDLLLGLGSTGSDLAGPSLAGAQFRDWQGAGREARGLAIEWASEARHSANMLSSFAVCMCALGLWIWLKT